MDGYAICKGVTPPCILQIAEKGHILAGYACAPDLLNADHTIWIGTGAPVPPNAVQIVPQELAERRGEKIALKSSDNPKSHIREVGVDYEPGDLLVSRGERITARTIATVAGAGYSNIVVARRPSVSILVTGSELVVPDHQDKSPFAFNDVLGDAIANMAQEWGARVIELVRCPDNVSVLKEVASRLTRSSDVVVVNGGASRGRSDFAKTSCSDSGLKIEFSDLLIKLGRPVWYGSVGTCSIVGLPGNPTAAITTARLFLEPLLSALQGKNCTPAIIWKPMPIADTLETNSIRESFLLAKSTPSGVEILKRQPSSSHAPLAQADTLVRRRANEPAQSLGRLVQCINF